jgi:hypothetical protein
VHVSREESGVGRLSRGRPEVIRVAASARSDRVPERVLRTTSGGLESDALATEIE